MIRGEAIDAFPPARRSEDLVAGAALSLLLLLAVATYGCWVVGGRGLDVGTDTRVYAGFFLSIGQQPIETRLEAGFVLVTYLLRKLGLDANGYLTAMFALLLLAVAAATRTYHRYLGGGRGYLTLLSAALMLLFVSPMFVNGSINAMRQGMAAPLVFAALLCFQQRRWWAFLAYGAVATSLHLSSLLYLACVPALLLSGGWQRVLAVAAFLVYVSGLSQILVQALLPALHTMVMEYTPNAYYRIGVRPDFAVFSFFWYVLAQMLLPLVRGEYRDAIRRSTEAYLVMLLPFFAIGWGYFSNRYLLPGWISVSLILAAVLCHSRLAPLRQPLLIRFGLVAACPVLYFLVTREIVI